MKKTKYIVVFICAVVSLIINESVLRSQAIDKTFQQVPRIRDITWFNGVGTSWYGLNLHYYPKKISPEALEERYPIKPPDISAKLLTLVNKTKGERNKSKILNDLNIYFNNFDMYDKAIEVSDTLPDKQMKCQVMYNMAEKYIYYRGQPEKAKGLLAAIFMERNDIKSDYYKKVIPINAIILYKNSGLFKDISELKVPSYDNVSRVIQNVALAEMSLDEGKIKDSEYFLKESYKINLQNNIIQWKIAMFVDIGIVYSKMGDDKNVIKMLKKAIEKLPEDDTQLSLYFSQWAIILGHSELIDDVIKKIKKPSIKLAIFDGIAKFYAENGYLSEAKEYVSKIPQESKPAKMDISIDIAIIAAKRYIDGGSKEKAIDVLNGVSGELDSLIKTEGPMYYIYDYINVSGLYNDLDEKVKSKITLSQGFDYLGNRHIEKSEDITEVIKYYDKLIKQCIELDAGYLVIEKLELQKSQLYAHRDESTDVAGRIKNVLDNHFTEIYVKTGNIDEAIDLINKQDDNIIKVISLLSVSEKIYKTGERDKALSLILEAKELLKTKKANDILKADLWTAVANWYININDKKEAIKALEAAKGSVDSVLYLTPKGSSLANIAFSYAKAGNLEKSEDLFGEILDKAVKSDENTANQFASHYVWGYMQIYRYLNEEEKKDIKK